MAIDVITGCDAWAWIEGGGRAGMDESAPISKAQWNGSLYLSLFDEEPRILDLGIPIHSRLNGTHAHPAPATGQGRVVCGLGHSTKAAPIPSPTQTDATQ